MQQDVILYNRRDGWGKKAGARQAADRQVLSKGFLMSTLLHK